MLNDWQVEKLRLSVFLVDMIDPMTVRCWESLFGIMPEEQRSQPQQHLTTEEGPFNDGRLRVEIRNKRYDWVFVPDLTNPTLELPTLGSYEAILNLFNELMQKWLSDNCPRINRVAYGGVLLLPTDNQIIACERLNELLPSVEIDPQNSRDLVYKINRRRKLLNIKEELGINRLATWSVIDVTNTILQISPNEPNSKMKQITKSRSVCRLELDINTTPEHSQLIDKHLVPEIFNELINVGNEIVIKGDIA